MLKENRGVTLVALVITIIVLLILAGVSIAMITGEEGILSKAQEAKDKNGKLLDAVSLAVAELHMNKDGSFTYVPTDIYDEEDETKLIKAQTADDFKDAVRLNYDKSATITVEPNYNDNDTEDNTEDDILESLTVTASGTTEIVEVSLSTAGKITSVEVVEED